MLENDLPENLGDPRIQPFDIKEGSCYLFNGMLEIKNPVNYVGEGYIVATVHQFELPQKVINPETERKYGTDTLRVEHVCSKCSDVSRGVNGQVILVLFKQKRIGYQGPYTDGMDIEDSRFPAIATTCKRNNQLVYSVCEKCPLTSS